MDLTLVLKAIVMGIIEGLTEFLPISSTGHLIIAGGLLQFDASIGGKAIADTFEIFIQLGAILAVVVYFIRDLLSLVRRAPHDRSAQRLLIGVAIAFIPAAVIGLLLDKYIEQYLFSAFTVGIALVAGGLIILYVEQQMARRETPADTVEKVTYKQSLGVGIAQIASLFPGMSRSASTIIGGMLAGLDRPTALRFSFYLSIPTMVAATLYKLVKELGNIHGNQAVAFFVGLVVSFLVALVVIKWFLGYVARHDLRPFAWYRLALGAVMIALYIPLPR
ncbi:MAG: undecaprenyl-diphosphate phosphatase [Chloroflexi bacterium]|nr:undecaprenyl-diphosphate phosphatase [Chloroflexota bacterium]MCL5275235.1 undecaprenyl-diphosphate phosphatase [Chloroflexota bacterium]